MPVNTPTYQSVLMTPSLLPPRKLCSVCGFESPYACIQCGMHYCSLKCRSAHRDTRCLKFVA